VTAAEQLASAHPRGDPTADHRVLVLDRLSQTNVAQPRGLLLGDEAGVGADVQNAIGFGASEQLGQMLMSGLLRLHGADSTLARCLAC